MRRFRGSCDALKSQLKEYDAIESEAKTIAMQRGWQLSDLNPGVRAMAEMMSRAQLLGGNRDSKIAGMMIQGNTRGIIMGLKASRETYSPDDRVGGLAQKLMDTENTNIQQMKPFL
ncbi:MAG: hypothetical protein LUH51_05380 [Firmicutes bacterium]|nr:hypothetical protein [Bacillota bacterium]